MESGDRAQVIYDMAGNTRLVVMATRGRTGLTRWPLGTVADRVAHSGEVSVWLVRAEWEPKQQVTFVHGRWSSLIAALSRSCPWREQRPRGARLP